jgi:hypothetical protein
MGPGVWFDEAAGERRGQLQPARRPAGLVSGGARGVDGRGHRDAVRRARGIPRRSGWYVWRRPYPAPGTELDRQRVVELDQDHSGGLVRLGAVAPQPARASFVDVPVLLSLEVPVPLSLRGRTRRPSGGRGAAGSDAEVGGEQQEPWRRQRLRPRRATPARAADPGCDGGRAGRGQGRAGRRPQHQHGAPTVRCSDRPRPAPADHLLPAEQAQSLAARRLLIFGVARFVARNGVNARGLAVPGEPLDVHGCTWRARCER